MTGSLEWREPSPSDERAFLERVRAGVPVGYAAGVDGRTASAFRRHARRHARFAAEYAAALRVNGKHPGLLAKLEAMGSGPSTGVISPAHGGPDPSAMPLCGSESHADAQNVCSPTPDTP